MMGLDVSLQNRRLWASKGLGGFSVIHPLDESSFGREVPCFWWEDDLLYDDLTWGSVQLSKVIFATEAGCCKAKSHSFMDVKSDTTALVCGQRVFDTLHHRVLS